MRGFTSLVLLSLSVFHISSTLARPRSLGYHPTPNNAIARRQHHTNRALADVCVDVDLSLLLHGVAGISLADVFGHICLCLSAFPLNLEAYVGLGAAVDVLGADKVEALLKVLIEKSGNQCTYPAHSKQQCSSGNPCDFTCNDGFTKHGDQCVCKSPYSECNGQCHYFPRGCSSSIPRSLQDQNSIPSNSRPTTLHEAQAVCGSDEVCGVHSKPDGYECINVKLNRESCGGCVVPHPFGSETRSSPGTDCSAIANSFYASCVSGKCVVEKCTENFQISTDRGSCVRTDVPPQTEKQLLGIDASAAIGLLT